MHLRKAMVLLSLVAGLVACQRQPEQTGAVITDTARVVATIKRSTRGHAKCCSPALRVAVWS